ncbi:MAG: thioredoxin domain-containing protein [Deltaproteobacteria bacterium]|nr:thioredoxin domain-containing protein [Deltaproteobacteria bacterium]
MKKLLGHICSYALAGLGISIYLLILHMNYDVLGGTCDMGSLFSCSVLLIKEYSLWFGVPVPVFSILLYLVVFGLAFSAYKHSDRDVIKQYLYLYLLAWLALAATVGMAFIAFVKLKTVCIFCSGLYIVSILFFIWIHKIRKADNRDWFSLLLDEILSIYKNKMAIKVLVALFIVILASYFHFQSGSMKIEFDRDSALMGRSVGNPLSSIKVEVFSDFQCPACKSAVPFLYLLEKELGPEIHLTYKYFPLDAACNSNVVRSLHPQACKAARASFCASLQNKFWRYHDFLFQNQFKLHDGIYKDIAEREGMKLGEFLQCLESDTSLRIVKADISQANMYNIQATPTIIVNGQPYTGKRTVEEFKKFIDRVK